ncbi:hypothetical protein BVG16_20155 [Paenibacillus selenitireducens]|uniref:Glycosyltransferase 2-like domain-containing protein n=1 Tax=Paenibacillus selenitireducens TaxID=1324314 RepID=A0A1T2X733_9BACL|nr:glycosyltransferase [Paenibacillus selenitireducens]OPA75652.1 hypothetical protein BVG16_20155 [Paenibacillus selenitireducens]
MITSIVIATFNKLEYTKACIESIRQYTAQDSYEIIVVDNKSTDGTANWLMQQNDIHVIFNDQNFGFPKACNQGIEVSNGDSILLLNNDTIVTLNWLDQMLLALYSAEHIGAVSTVTNNCSNYQEIPVPYNTIEEMQKFAGSYNRSNHEQWEDRGRLIGYNLLIKKHVLEEIGLLDEMFTPGNYEDDDLSLRIRLAGYRLLLCKDTFIHHFGSTSFRDNAEGYLKLMKINQQKFLGKWGFSPHLLSDINYYLVNQVQNPRDALIKVLVVGCGVGAYFIELRNRYPKAEFFGIEKNEKAAKVANLVASINVHELGEYSFDYIIINNIEERDNLKDELTYYSKCLSSTGKCILILPHLLHHSILHNLINGGIDRQKLNYLQSFEIEPLCKEAGFERIESMALTSSLTDMESFFVEQLQNLSNQKSVQTFAISCFLVTATKQTLEEEIKSVLNELIIQTDTSYYVMKLVKYDVEEILKVVKSSSGTQVIEVLNYIGMCLVEHSEPKSGLPYLTAAFEIDNENHTTLLNLGVTMYLLGNLELSLEWLELISNKTEHIQKWITQIHAEISSQ